MSKVLILNVWQDLKYNLLILNTMNKSVLFFNFFLRVIFLYLHKLNFEKSTNRNKSLYLSVLLLFLPNI